MTAFPTNPWTETRDGYVQRVATLEAALERSRKQVVMLTRLAALHKSGRDEAREDLHAARSLLGAVRALCEGCESEGQGFVAVSDVRAAMAPQDKP